MRMRLFILLGCILVCVSSFGQRQGGKNSLDGLPLKERLYFGGGGSFNGGTDVNGYRYTYVAINPMVGYRVTVPFSVGSFVNYTVVNYPDVKKKVSQYGLSPFAQYRVGRLFGYAEYSFISVPNYDNTYRATYTRIPVGVGYSQPIGRKAALNAMILYDLKHNRNVAYFPQPFIIRVFITAGGISM